MLVGYIQTRAKASFASSFHVEDTNEVRFLSTVGVLKGELRGIPGRDHSFRSLAISNIFSCILREGQIITLKISFRARSKPREISFTSLNLKFGSIMGWIRFYAKSSNPTVLIFQGKPLLDVMLNDLIGPLFVLSPRAQNMVYNFPNEKDQQA